MRILDLLRNGAILALFLSSCNSPCSQQWCCNEIPVFPVDYSSRRIYLPANNGFNQVEVELVQTRCNLRMYINSHGMEIPADPCDPDKALVFVSFRTHSYTTKFDRFVGGHRLLVPEAVRDEIVNTLLAGQPVYLRVGGFEADIMPDKFAAIYHR